jgi:hypothetical protein
MPPASPDYGPALDAYDVAASRIDADTRAAIDAFWKRFAVIAPQLDDAFNQRSEFDVAGETNAALGPLQGLDWEYGPGAEGGHCLCVSAGFKPSQLAIARAVLRAAPEIPGWTFSDARAGNAPDSVPDMVEARTGERYRDFRYRVFEDKHQMIGIEVLVPDRTDPDIACAIADMTLTCLLGEADERVWLSSARPAKAGGFFRKAPAGLSLAEVKPAIDALRARIDASLPDRRWSERNLESEETTWSSLQTDADPEGAYAFRQDLYVAVSPYPQRLSAALTSERFQSRRFSRLGETFAYFKIDGAEDGSLGQLEDREDLENLISGALRDAGLGTSIGGGTGLRYSYVELALCGDLNEALEAMGSV